MTPQVEKPTLAEAKRVSRWMRAIYLARATKAQRGQQQRFLEADDHSDNAAPVVAAAQSVRAGTLRSAEGARVAGEVMRR